MWKTRIAWLGFVLACVGAYVFDNGTGTRLLLAGALAAPLVSALWLYLAPGGGEVTLSAPGQLELGQSAEVLLRARRTGLLPVRLRCVLTARNAMTGQSQSMVLTLRPHRAGEGATPITLTPDHCGAVHLELSGCRQVDWLGLWARPAWAGEPAVCLVLPKTRRLSVRLGQSGDFLQDSQLYSAQKPGYDPSETFRIREYVPGDPLRQIHWKLSQKTDKLLVREFGLPIVERMLLLAETTGIPGTELTPHGMDLLLARLAAVSGELTAQGIDHVLGWTQRQTDTYCSREIRQPEDLLPALAELLEQPIGPGQTTVAGSFGREHAMCAYAHVAVFSTYPAPDLSLLCHGNRVTLVLDPADARQLGAWEQGAEVIACDENTTQLEL